jgi:hypothetical protein
MSRTPALSFVAGSLVFIAAQHAHAQATVQQPVVEVVSADSVVSVPDRGRLFLGGVSSGAESRVESGPLPWGTATGRSSSRSSLDVGVFIHDFEAIDEYLLSLPVRSNVVRQSPAGFRSTRAAAAWKSLIRRDASSE